MVYVEFYLFLLEADDVPFYVLVLLDRLLVLQFLLNLLLLHGIELPLHSLQTLHQTLCPPAQLILQFLDTIYC